MKTQVIKQQVRTRKGLYKRNPQQALRIFERAISAYNEGQKYFALQTARYALKIARRNGEYIKAYISGFLAQIKLELGQVHLAKSYCMQAIQSLEKFHIDYEKDKGYYETLLRSIESESRN